MQGFRLNHYRPFLRHAWIPALILFHFVKVFFLFKNIDFSSPFPILNQNYALYYARALRAHEFLTHAARMWGYDPFEMAGYISGVYQSVGSYFFNLIAHLFYPLLSIGKTLLLIEMGGFLTAPFFLFWAARNFGGDKTQSWMAFGVAALMSWVVDFFSAVILESSLFGFQISVFVGLWQVSLLWKWMKQGGWQTWGLLTLVTACLFQIHPASLVTVFVPNMVITMMCFRSLDFRRQAAISISVILVFLSNWYWIHPFLSFSDWWGTAPYFPSMGWRGILYMINPLRSGTILSIQFFSMLILIFFAANTLFAERSGFSEKKTIFLTWAAWLIAIAFFGSAIPWIKKIQPARYYLALASVTYLLSGFSMSTACRQKGTQKTILILFLMGTLAVNVFSCLSGRLSRFTNTLPQNQAFRFALHTLQFGAK